MSTRQARANAIRFLAMDAVQKANSGHPGMPMGMADIAEVLWHDFLKHNPTNPKWINRDRFILSNGHGSMLQYALLHLTGYDLSVNDLKNFRQLHSKTPGHPEVDETPGVETTTGPLGQGLANSVGMAIAEKILAAQFNQTDFSIIDHYTYVFAGDGCLMEGVSHEACSLAGTLGLGKLIVFWDDNKISIDGELEGWFSVKVSEQFRAYGWQVIENIDGHSSEQIEGAIRSAQLDHERPTLICCRTTIGHGAPTLAGKAVTHGAPLGDAEIYATREKLAWQHEAFSISDEIYSAWSAEERGAQLEDAWQTLFSEYQKQYPELATELLRRIDGDLPIQSNMLFQELIQQGLSQEKALSTRKASGQLIAKIANQTPELLGGSADLSESNCTHWSQARALSKQQADANYIHYGVREFGMGAIMNGIALHGGFIPFGGTFLVFQSYMANATRMSALMKRRIIYVFTHDSIGLGEDGPTHQPVMEASTLRMTPHMNVWRPCDLLETTIAWKDALQNKHNPTALLLSRQNLVPQSHTKGQVEEIQRGGYVLFENQDHPEVILIATGSEVELAMQVAKKLVEKGVAVRVVSMPCCEIFLRQEEEYREKVLPFSVRKRVAIEASASAYWYRFVGLDGVVIGLDRFGASAPEKDVYAECGFTVEKILEKIKQL